MPGPFRITGRLFQTDPGGLGRAICTTCVSWGFGIAVRDRGAFRLPPLGSPCQANIAVAEQFLAGQKLGLDFAGRRPGQNWKT